MSACTDPGSAMCFEDDADASPIYRPIKPGEVRILCLQPGEPGSPWKATFELLSLDVARRAQPDLGSCDPQHLDFDQSETTLRRWREILTRHELDYADLSERCDGVGSLHREIRDLLWQRRDLENALLRSSKVSNDSSSKATEQRLTSDTTSISAEVAALDKVSHELSGIWVSDVYGLGDKYDPLTYSSLFKTARLLTRLAQVKRDEAVHHATAVGSYETLSYAWGTFDLEQRMQIGECGQHLRISATVFEALQQLRYQDRRRKLWIDALCINQPDLVERAHQISNMSEIYGAAARTIVWLGTAEPSICLAYGVLHAHLSAHTFNLARSDPGSKIDLHISETLNSSQCCEYCGEPFAIAENRPELGMAAMESLATKPWFTRLWVVQEVASAKFAEVHCGAHQISYEVFDLLLRMLCELRDVVRDTRLARDLKNERYSPCVLIWFLVVTSTRKCTLDEDRVYAIQGITGLTTDHIEDIGRKMHFTELFIRMTEHCLTSRYSTPPRGVEEHRFNVPHVALLLALAPKTKSRATVGLPSWVPNWSYVPKTAHGIMLQYSHGLSDDFRFGQSSNPGLFIGNLNLMECYTKDSKACLSIKGYHFGRIAEVLRGSELPTTERTLDTELPEFDVFLQWFGEKQRSWLRLCVGLAEKHWPSHEFMVKMKELLQHVSLRGGGYGYSYEMLSYAEYNRYEQAARPLPASREEVYNACILPLEDEGGAVDPQKLAYWMCDSLWDEDETHRIGGRSLCSIRTSSDEIYLGWVPPTAEVGDCICLFSGAPRPYVVRPDKDHHGSFELLGDSWVHDMCELDIMDFCREHEANLEWIDLR